MAGARVDCAVELHYCICTIPCIRCGVNTICCNFLLTLAVVRICNAFYGEAIVMMPMMIQILSSLIVMRRTEQEVASYKGI